MSNEPKVARKLRAILSADVKGYSLLMADDDVHTIETLKKYRHVMADLIDQHSGRVVDTPGDNLLAEFSSAVDAVDCAVKIQNRLIKENAKFVVDRRLQFRIGINIGDVVQDGDRIYGSGVNIAARIEGIANEGGICISRNTYDHVIDKLGLSFEYLGEHEVKNIEEPVRVYKVLTDIDAPKPLVEERLELPDKPSIAVLPFTNMSGDPSQEYFSDGLTEQIINGLCKVSGLFVIARNSSFAYKGKAVSVKKIAKELGVRYILEGSVQRAGARVRITGQLIDAITDFHMWSETYDRNLEDIFALQDEITMRLITAMMVKLTHGAQAKLWRNTQTFSVDAYDKLFRAIDLQNSFSKQGIRESIRFAEEALSLDEKWSNAHMVLGMSHWLELSSGWSNSVIDSFLKMEQCAERALELSDASDWVHILIACINLIKRDFDTAVKHGKIALLLNPNGADAHANLAFIYCYSGKPSRAIDLFELAFRLNPIPPSWYYHNHALAFFLISKYNESIQACRKCIRVAPDSTYPHLFSAASFASIGKLLDASKSIREVQRIFPKYTIKTASKMAFNKEKDLNKLLEALRKAGLPD